MAETYGGYPDTAKAAARRALRHRDKNGSKCGTPVGWERANQIASGEKLSLSTVKRTFSFLSRAETYNKGKFTDEDGREICGSVMYAAWGGTTMRSWCSGIINKVEGRSEITGEVKKGLEKKVEEHNKSVDSSAKKTNLRTLSTVFRRGVGAYKTNPGSVRPNVKSPEQWAYARVNSYLYALKNEKFRSGKHDTDLFPKGHPLSSK